MPFVLIRRSLPGRLLQRHVSAGAPVISKQLLWLKTDGRRLPVSKTAFSMYIGLLDVEWWQKEADKFPSPPVHY